MSLKRDEDTCFTSTTPGQFGAVLSKLQVSKQNEFFPVSALPLQPTPSFQYHADCNVQREETNETFGKNQQRMFSSTAMKQNK